MTIELNRRSFKQMCNLDKEECTHEFYQKLLVVLLEEDEELKAKFEIAWAEIMLCHDCEEPSHGDETTYSYLPAQVESSETFDQIIARTTHRDDIANCKCEHCSDSSVKLVHNERRKDQATVVVVFTKLPECLFISFSDGVGVPSLKVLDHLDIENCNHKCEINDAVSLEAIKADHNVMTEAGENKQLYKCIGFISYIKQHNKKTKG